MNLPNLGDYDIDEHLPTNLNSSYHTLQDISNSDYSQNDFSLLHMNIRSLSCHFDELFSTLVSLKIKFDIVGVSASVKRRSCRSTQVKSCGSKLAAMGILAAGSQATDPL